MTDKSIVSDQYDALLKLLNEWAFAYYVEGVEEVPNGTYDLKYQQLVDLEKAHPELVSPNSPTQRVGGAPLLELPKVKHKQPMYSLESCMTQEAYIKYANDNIISEGIEQAYYAEPKYDGLSLSLTYVHGTLSMAATRGDGETGEVVTEQAKTIRTIPLFVKALEKVPVCEIRGETLLTLPAYAALNAHLESTGEKPYANPRNAASGALRQLDPKYTALCNLTFLAYSFAATGTGFDETLPRKQSERIALLKEYGFTVSPLVAPVRGLEGVHEHFQKMAQLRESLPFEIDGVVFKVDSIDDQEQLGWLSRVPRFAFAAKFPPPTAITKLLNITISVGRTGVQTPVAVLAPVKCGGVTVTSANLFNEGEVKRLGINIGDAIQICRAGDVIPDVVGLADPSTAIPDKSWSMPSTCACCSAPVVKEEGKANYYCTAGIACSAQQVEALNHYGSRQTLNIDSFGEGVAEKLFEAGLIRTPRDLYALQEADIARLPGMGKRSAQKLLKAIEATKSPEWAKFIHAIGIRNVGESTSKALSQAFRTPGELKFSTREQLLALDDVGPITADSIRKYFTTERSLEEYESLLQHVTPVPPVAKVTEGPLLGKIVVITGTLSASRDVFKKRVEIAGGQTSDSVSKKTHYLLAGEAAGSKLTKATSLGIRVLNEDEFNELLGISN